MMMMMILMMRMVEIMVVVVLILKPTPPRNMAFGMTRMHRQPMDNSLYLCLCLIFLSRLVTVHYIFALRIQWLPQISTPLSPENSRSNFDLTVPSLDKVKAKSSRSSTPHSP